MRRTTLSRHRPALALVVLAAACVTGLPPTTGTQAVPLVIAADIKTRAVRGALAEISLSSDNAAIRYGVYLDTLVGPTPEEYLYAWAHPRPWLDAMVANGLVEGLFGVPAYRSGLPRTAFAIEIGEPYPAGPDTLAVVYDWCVRRFPTENGIVGTATVWRDAFVRADSGWARVGHVRTMAPSACTP
ncbi:MAG: hypothetical protein ABJB33_07320 [Gemmatimonadota bacterium]